MLNETIIFRTDAATLAVFDPAVLAPRMRDEVDWWSLDWVDLPEVQRGELILIGTGADGQWQARVTESGLTDDERDYAVEVCVVGLEVRSGPVFFGQGECLPGEGLTIGPDDLDGPEGRFLELRPGRYDITAYKVAWYRSSRWWSTEVRDPSGPPDFVLDLRPRTGAFPGVAQKPRLTGDSLGFLFESSTRLVGPTVGMLLETKVRRGPKGLVLKQCGPLDYRPHLRDFAGVEQGDRVRIKVTTVDHDRESMEVDLVGVLPPLSRA